MEARRALHQEMGTTVRTLWATSFPLTSYQRFQLHVHRLRAASGFSTRVLVPQHRRYLECAGPLSELVVYEGHAVYLPHFTPQGHPNGATRVNDLGLADALTEQLDALDTAALALDVFARPHR